MTKEEVEKWCEENNYIVVDLNKKEIPVEIVVKIAEKAVGVEDLRKKTHGHKYTFGRYLAIDYLFNKMPTELIAISIGLERTMVYHAKKQKLMTTELKYFKGWQRQAIVFFRDKIGEVEKFIKD